MNTHRVLLTLSAICILTVGIIEATLGFTKYRIEALDQAGEFIDTYLPRDEGERYAKMFHEALELHSDHCSSVVQYHVMLGGAAIAIAMLIFAVLADTRNRGGRKNETAP